MWVDADGGLIVRTPLGEAVLKAPVTYQEVGGERRPVASRYRLNEGMEVVFELGLYDQSRALIIDPVLVYSTYLGGSGSDRAQSLAVGPDGAVYVAGFTTSPDFPATPGAFDGTYGGGSGGGGDVFVAKLNADGDELLYATYLGRRMQERWRSAPMALSTSRETPNRRTFLPPLGRSTALTAVAVTCS